MFIDINIAVAFIVLDIFVCTLLTYSYVVAITKRKQAESLYIKTRYKLIKMDNLSNVCLKTKLASEAHRRSYTEECAK